MLNSTEDCRRTANLGVVTCEIKGERPKISTVNGQTAKKGWSRSRSAITVVTIESMGVTPPPPFLARGSVECKCWVGGCP